VLLLVLQWPGSKDTPPWFEDKNQASNEKQETRKQKKIKGL
jgi:hypothetical protein